MQWRGDRVESVTVQAAGRPNGHRVDEGEQQPLHRARPFPVANFEPIVGGAGHVGQREGEEEEAEEDVDQAEVDQEDVVGGNLERKWKSESSLNVPFALN